MAINGFEAWEVGGGGGGGTPQKKKNNKDTKKI